MKGLKKFGAIICAIAMIVSSITYYPTSNVSAATALPKKVIGLVANSKSGSDTIENALQNKPLHQCFRHAVSHEAKRCRPCKYLHSLHHGARHFVLHLLAVVWRRGYDPHTLPGRCSGEYGRPEPHDRHGHLSDR